MEVSIPDTEPQEIDTASENERIVRDNTRGFQDPFDGLRDAKLRRTRLADIQVLLMIFERLGAIGRVLEEIRDNQRPGGV